MDDPSAHVPDPVRPPPSGRNWPLNTWWVAAHGSEITDKPTLRWICENPVVLYRTGGGRIAALHDRCPHRWAPLSMGEVAGEDIVCGYHGMRFSPEGRCVRVPTQATVPPIRVRAFPVEERHGFVWLWTGEASAADPAAIPEDFAYFTDPAWRMVWGYRAVNANYMQLEENILDLSHIAFLHKNSVMQDGWEQMPVVEVEDARVTVRHFFEPGPLPPVFAASAGKPLDKVIHRSTWGAQILPGMNDGGVIMHDPDPGPDGLADFQVRIVHIFTPVSPGKTHYFWAMARDHGEPYDVETARAASDLVFDEDVLVTERTQALLQRAADQDSAIEFSVAADRGAIMGRRQVARMIEAEKRASDAAAGDTTFEPRHEDAAG